MNINMNFDFMTYFDVLVEDGKIKKYRNYSDDKKNIDNILGTIGSQGVFDLKNFTFKGKKIEKYGFSKEDVTNRLKEIMKGEFETIAFINTETSSIQLYVQESFPKNLLLHIKNNYKGYNCEVKFKKDKVDNIQCSCCGCEDKNHA